MFIENQKFHVDDALDPTGHPFDDAFMIAIIDEYYAGVFKPGRIWTL